MKGNTMKKLLVIFLLVMLLLAGCSDSETSVETPEFFTEAPTPVSYLLRKSQGTWQMRQGVGAWLLSCSHIPGSAYHWSDHEWRSDNMIFTQYTSSGEALAQVKFTFNGWDPDRSSLTYGETKIISNTENTVSGSAYLIDNSGGEDPDTFDRKESITEHKERSTSTDTEWSVDVGTSTTATIGGDDFGATLEQQITASFGLKTDTATAQSESTDKTVEVDFNFEIPGGRATLAEVRQGNIASQTPFTLDGIPDYKVKVGWNTGTAWTGSPCLTAITDTDSGNKSSGSVGEDSFNYVQWDTLDDFNQMLAGENVDWPTAGPNNVHVNAHALAAIQSDWAWRIRNTGIQKRNYADSSTIITTDVTGQDLDEVAEKNNVADDRHIVCNNGCGS